MNPESQNAIDEFIDGHFEIAKSNFIKTAFVDPEVFFFFRNRETEEKPYMSVPIPDCLQFFLPPAPDTELLRLHIEKFHDRLKSYAELIAIVLFTDMYFTEFGNHKSYHEPGPKHNVVRKDALGYMIDTKDPSDSFAYYYPYFNNTHQICFEKDRVELIGLNKGHAKHLFPKNL